MTPQRKPRATRLTHVLGTGVAPADLRIDVRARTGGTLLEAPWLLGRAEGCLAWWAAIGFPCVEVPNGVAGTLREKAARLVLALESLRRGLRADTIHLLTGATPMAAAR